MSYRPLGDDYGFAATSRPSSNVEPIPGGASVATDEDGTFSFVRLPAGGDVSLRVAERGLLVVGGRKAATAPAEGVPLTVRHVTALALRAVDDGTNLEIGATERSWRVEVRPSSKRWSTESYRRASLFRQLADAFDGRHAVALLSATATLRLRRKAGFGLCRFLAFPGDGRTRRTGADRLRCCGPVFRECGTGRALRLRRFSRPAVPRRCRRDGRRADRRFRSRSEAPAAGLDRRTRSRDCGGRHRR